VERPIGETDGGDGAAAKRESVGEVAVAKDHTICWHLRDHRQLFSLSDCAPAEFRAALDESGEHNAGNLGRAGEHLLLRER
jgi:hypothetical protein